MTNMANLIDELIAKNGGVLSNKIKFISLNVVPPGCSKYSQAPQVQWSTR